jgi:membrane peptidoglycan carboxypeptidase
MSRPTMRFVPVKTAEQQAALTMLGVRDLLIKQRTMLINALGNISPHLIRAAMAGEDTRFCRHHGFDWGAIETAWDRYQSGHGRLLGAGTISMQTAKNVFLWPGRDWLRQGFEAWFTALIVTA